MKTVEILGFLRFLSSPSIRTVIQEIDEHQTSGGGWLDRVFTDDGSLDRGAIWHYQYFAKNQTKHSKQCAVKSSNVRLD